MGENIVFLHGGGQGSWVWEDTITELKNSTRCMCNIHTLDVPGCGRKRKQDTQDVYLTDIADELISEIEWRELDSIFLVGHAQAGVLMSLMLKSRPDLFRRLIYVTASIPRKGQSIVEMTFECLYGDKSRGLIGDNKMLGPSFGALFCGDMNSTEADRFLSRIGYDKWPEQSNYFTNWDYEHHHRVPSTYIICERSKFFPVSWQKVFAKRFGAKRLVRINAGHQVMNSRPKSLTHILANEISSTIMASCNKDNAMESVYF